MSHLYDLAIAFGNKTPPPGDMRSPGVTWNNACGSLTNQFALYIGGWDKNPSNYGPVTVGTVYSASTIRSKVASAAPINAKHWFKLSSGAWHVMTDLNGGGSDCLSASGRAAKADLGNYMRIQSVAGYLATGGATYMGWSTDYAGATSKYREPVVTPPAPVLGKTQRLTVSPKGANVRSTPEVINTPEPGNKLMPIKPGVAVTMSGYVLGVDGFVWFRHQWGYSRSDAFTDGGTHDLPDLTPAPVPPPVVKHTIRFISNDAVLSTSEVEEGTKPTITVPPPVEGYTFNGWAPEIVPATADADYRAVWKAVVVEQPPVVTPPIVIPPTDDQKTSDLKRFLALAITVGTAILAALAALLPG